MLHLVHVSPLPSRYVEVQDAESRLSLLEDNAATKVREGTSPLVRHLTTASACVLCEAHANVCTLPQRTLCDLVQEIREYRSNLKPFLKVLQCLLRPLPEAPLGLKVHVREESIS